MDTSDQLTANASPDHRFQPLNQSQQIIHEDQIRLPEPISMKVAPSDIQKKLLFFKDLKRNKIVCCPIEFNKNAILDHNSRQTTELKQCRICLQEEELSSFVTPCLCKGSLQHIHEHCLKVWILEKQGIEKLYTKDIVCEVCHHKLYMRTEFTKKCMPSLLFKAPRARLICWCIQIGLIIGMIGLMLYLILLIIDGNVDAIVFAGITVIFVLFVLVVAVLYAGCVDQMTVEMLHLWKFVNHNTAIKLLQWKKSTKKGKTPTCATETADPARSPTRSPMRYPTHRQMGSTTNMLMRSIQLDQA